MAGICRLLDDDYEARMLHRIPAGPVVSRGVYVLRACEGQVVLHVGASGLMHHGLRTVAAKVYGLDLHPETPDVFPFDLDVIGVPLPQFTDVTQILCGEVLEHLSNPGYLLTRLRATYPGVPLLVTAPNAFSSAAHQGVQTWGVENVNADHVAWYSYRTLHELLRRAGYAVRAHAWYGGTKQANTAEGLIVRAEPV